MVLRVNEPLELVALACQMVDAPSQERLTVSPAAKPPTLTARLLPTPPAVGAAVTAAAPATFMVTVRLTPLAEVATSG